jgi:hypothetical protein
MNAHRRISIYTRVRPSVTPRQRRRVVHKARGKERAAALVLLSALAISACSGSGSHGGEAVRVVAGTPHAAVWWRPTTTTQPPPTTAVTRSESSGRSRVPSSRPRSAPTGDFAGCVRQKESSNDYGYNDGQYHGAYNMTLSHWDGYGGYSRPEDAPPSVQDAKFQSDAARGSAYMHQQYPVTSRACGA